MTHFCTFLGFPKKIMKIQENHEIRRSKVVPGPQAAPLIPAMCRLELKLPNIFFRAIFLGFLISAFVSFLETSQFCKKIVNFLKKVIFTKIWRCNVARRPQAAPLIPTMHRFELKLPNIFPGYVFSRFFDICFRFVFRDPRILSKNRHFLKKVIFTQIAVSAPIWPKFCLWAHISYTFKRKYSKLPILNF